MAKKDYPGLVLVPPSDRTILRRRLLRWSLLLIAVVWIIWTALGSPPPSLDKTDCQEATGQGRPSVAAKECGSPDQVTATVSPPENDVNPLQISQAEKPAEPQHSVSPPPPEDPQPSPAPISQEIATPKPAVILDPPKNQTEIQPNKEITVARTPAQKPTTSPSPDARLAEQGDAFAQYRLGKHYAKQKGPQSAESLTWYKKASAGLHRLADAGNGQAMYVLGVMYAYGRGVARNTEQARHWLSRAVRQNVTAAQPVLSNLESRQPAALKPKDNRPAHNTKR
ncbi:MAG: tetratricopeptide repeat protein [Nitrospira sp.]